MNTPRTDSLEKFLIEGNSSTDLGKFQRMSGHARQLERELTEAVGALAAYTVISPAFRAKDIGAPNSFERTKQEMHIKLEDQARAILEKTK